MAPMNTDPEANLSPTAQRLLAILLVLAVIFVALAVGIALTMV